MINEDVIQAVWDKAKAVDGYNPATIRKDSCGAWIIRSEYGNTESMYGWEIDHVYPVEKGGDDSMDNLRAMQWENNRAKGNDYPSYRTRVQAENSENIYKDSQFSVNIDLQNILRLKYGL